MSLFGGDFIGRGSVLLMTNRDKLPVRKGLRSLCSCRFAGSNKTLRAGEKTTAGLRRRPTASGRHRKLIFFRKGTWRGNERIKIYCVQLLSDEILSHFLDYVLFLLFLTLLHFKEKRREKIPQARGSGYGRRSRERQTRP